MAPKTKPETELPATYEAAVAELEQWVGRMEGGDLPLDDLLQAYQRSAQLLEFCRSKLQAIEQQIQVLDEGVMKPWLEGN
ncbi:MAG: exodeoxyribonuclease VII small subunit [Alphaproteobacteria bacterium]|nr:exodeoxyribonuclease VII small subunit [Alphaproteobacteria bacterium]